MSQHTEKCHWKLSLVPLCYNMLTILLYLYLICHCQAIFLKEFEERPIKADLPERRKPCYHASGDRVDIRCVPSPYCVFTFHSYKTEECYPIGRIDMCPQWFDLLEHPARSSRDLCFICGTLQEALGMVCSQFNPYPVKKSMFHCF